MFTNKLLAALRHTAHSATFKGGRTHRLTGALFVLGASLQLTATTIPYKSLDDLVREADAIVSGRVAQVESKYSPDKEIFTFVTFDQLEVLGGSYTGSSLTLRFLGGKIDNDISQVVGSPTFAVDDKVVLFVHGNGRYMVPLVGWTQGVFRIGEDAATGQLAVRDHEGNRVLGIQNGRLLKQTLVRPAADIVGEFKSKSTEPAAGKTNAGLADYGESAPVVETAESSSTEAAVNLNRAGSRVMTYQRFRSAISGSASGKASWGRLESIGVQNFERPSRGADARVESRPVRPSVVDQRPTLPKPAPVVTQNDQQ